MHFFDILFHWPGTEVEYNNCTNDPCEVGNNGLC